MPSKRFPSTDDEALRILPALQEEVESLVREFLGRGGSGETEWLDTWFVFRIKEYFSGPLSDPEPYTRMDPVPIEAEATHFAQPIELKSMQIHHFRGFRGGQGEIDLKGKLCVVQGDNSSGKTSLAEALEWLLTGSLSRRENSSSGNARELAHCIANRHRPPDKDTWVSATFSLPVNADSEGFTLRRVLKEDYGTTAKATSSSALFLNDRELMPEQEKQVLDEYFAGVPPLLMQHTLRDFVQGAPKSRQRYFERLLRISEIGELISCAKITDVQLKDFPCPQEGEFLYHWNQLEPLLKNDLSRAALKELLSGDKYVSEEDILEILSSISRYEFPSLLVGLSKKEEIVAALLENQENVRRESFPLLKQLQPQRRLSDYARETISKRAIDALSQEIRSAWEDYEPNLVDVHALSDEEQAVSKAFEILLSSGAVQVGGDSQSCPLCAYEHQNTLSVSRIRTIERWNSVRDSAHSSRQKLEQAIDSVLAIVKQALKEFEDLVPCSPEQPDWDNAIQTAGENLGEEAEELRGVLQKLRHEFLPFVSRGRELIETSSKSPASLEQCESFIRDASEVALGLANVPKKAKEYVDLLSSLEDSVEREALKNQEYLLSERILFGQGNVSSIAKDFRWEHAKRLAQQELKLVREWLITYRHEFLENRRIKFTDGIESVWKSLRGEDYSDFSRLLFPQSRGKGYQVEIELKALLDDSNEELEVDALSVFSESQVNALGIAAFVTRSQLLGHRILIFDDPVQSMDKDHFKTFASELIRCLLKEGFQIILLTHNDAFARAISHHHYDFPDYVTMETIHSRAKGSEVKEGNRTIKERLKKASRMIEQGEKDSSWVNIRCAIERQFTLAYIKYGPQNFEPATWENISAQDMWKKGARDVVLEIVPDCEKRLKDILEMTADGAHVTAAYGRNEIKRSIKFLKKLNFDLRAGI